jgi:hypothetical protein
MLKHLKDFPCFFYFRLSNQKSCCSNYFKRFFFHERTFTNFLFLVCVNLWDLSLFAHVIFCLRLFGARRNSIDFLSHFYYSSCCCCLYFALLCVVSFCYCCLVLLRFVCFILFPYVFYPPHLTLQKPPSFVFEKQPKFLLN